MYKRQIVSAAAKAVPGAAKHINADQQLVKDLRDIGISIIVEEAYAINQEIKKHTQKIQEQLEKLKKALEQLAGTLTAVSYTHLDVYKRQAFTSRKI